MTLPVVGIDAAAGLLQQPFQMRPLVSLGHLVLSVFICQGQMEWHKHLDEDELFLVHEGVIGLDTDRGNLSLHAEELVVVPRGVMHRSKSMLRSVVVLLRPAALTERTNGHRRFYATDDEPPLEKVRLSPTLAVAGEPFRPVTVGQVDDHEVLALTGRGIGPQWTAAPQGALWLVVRGGLRVETGAGTVAQLSAGDLTLVPGGADYRLTCPGPSLLLTAART